MTDRDNDRSFLPQPPTRLSQIRKALSWAAVVVVAFVVFSGLFPAFWMAAIVYTLYAAVKVMTVRDSGKGFKPKDIWFPVESFDFTAYGLGMSFGLIRCRAPGRSVSDKAKAIANGTRVTHYETWKEPAFVRPTWHLKHRFDQPIARRDFRTLIAVFLAFVFRAGSATVG
jgi:hypothetical protein